MSCAGADLPLGLRVQGMMGAPSWQSISNGEEMQ